jgi:hypothetical protein
MSSPRPGKLSVRAVNQYRRRDVLTYLALRYYLANAAARSDQWAQRVATDLVLTRSRPVYFRALHFKDHEASGGVEHRRVFLPGANEALAEAALLDECSNHPAEFSNPPFVFSYELSQGEDRAGIFQPYFGGLHRRHEAIVDACDNSPSGIVRYADIKRFYPSIKGDLALEVWSRQAERAKLASHFRELGERLIEDHRESREPGDRGILTGPMFSHLLGNLVLRKLDQECLRVLPARYFRYVDDIALVGEQQAVEESLHILRQHLADLGLELHDDSSPKSISVDTNEWLEGRNDFRESRRTTSWMTFIGDLKKFLLSHPDRHEELRRAFVGKDLRIPIRSYSEVVREASHLEKVLHWSEWHWFRRKARSISVEALVSQALWLRQSYEAEFRELMDGAASLRGFSLKRRIPKLRYRASRLIYLATDESLSSLSSEAAELSELHFHSEIMAAVASGNIDRLLPLGSNAAQAAAQPLRAANRPAILTSVELGEAETQGLAVFLLNGVTVERRAPAVGQESELIRFAIKGADVGLMKSGHPFTRELACLHGLSDQPRHPEILETAFDEDEDLVMDAIDQIQQSLSP